MTIKTVPFDPADVLDTPTACAAYLNDALESGDARELIEAMGVVARARGLTALAKEAGLSRPSLYRAFSADGNPEFATVARVLDSMGLRLAVQEKPRERA